jgi:hypothetical protein
MNRPLLIGRDYLKAKRIDLIINNIFAHEED